VRVVSLEELAALSSEDRLRLTNLDARVWSGMCVPLPDGSFLAILHPQQTPERANVTLMEEVCHAYFGHKPSRLERQPNGLMKREYDEDAERQAYWTAGATLLPSEVVAKAVWRGQTAEELAAEYGTSTELAEMRIKTLGLWDEYTGPSRKAS
jgi:Zn-dependent peptidase ImmA (M78 family)